MKIYAIGGLGADERVFQDLSIDVIPLKWLKPGQHESLDAYAHRFGDQIDTSRPFILIGVSFGGMVAVELNKILKPEKTIIISSAATKQELPTVIKILRRINPISIIPKPLLKPPLPLMAWAFGVKRKKNKALLKTIIKDTDPEFLKWAMAKIIHWDNMFTPKNLVRIHGTSDRILKMNGNAAYKIVKGGGHFMIVEQADVISKIIASELL